MVEATNEQLLAALAGEIGELRVNQQWLSLQLQAANAQLAAGELEQSALTTQLAEMGVERTRLVARLAELEPPPPTGPTPTKAGRSGRR
jgi:hypothetical protein